MFEDDNDIMHPTQMVLRDVNSALQYGTSLPYDIEYMELDEDFFLTDGMDDEKVSLKKGLDFCGGI